MSSCVFNKISCFQRFPEVRAFGCERSQTQIISYRNAVQVLMPQGVGLGKVGWGNRMWGVGRGLWGWEQSCLIHHSTYIMKCWPVQNKKQIDIKASALQLSIFLSSASTNSCFDDIWYALHMVTVHFWSHLRDKGREMTKYNSSTSYKVTLSACLQAEYLLSRKYKASS